MDSLKMVLYTCQACWHCHTERYTRKTKKRTWSTCTQEEKKKKAAVSSVFSPLLTARSKSDEFLASRRNWHEKISFKKLFESDGKRFPALTRTQRTFSSCDHSVLTDVALTS